MQHQDIFYNHIEFTSCEALIHPEIVSTIVSLASLTASESASDIGSMSLL